jgi:hypothetical protein
MADRPGQADAGGHAGDASTLAEVVGRLEADGYTGELVVRAGDSVECRQCGRRSDPADLVVEDLLRTEGASDPADMAAVVAARCPACGAGATLIAHYGATAGPEESDVLARLHAP